jgi:hypothetical protein
MARFTEDQLKGWIKPPSETESSKLGNAERMVREAINADETLKGKSTEVFGQGSYANNTNVRVDSDIDINIRYTGGYYYTLPEGKTLEDIGDNSPSSEYTYNQFKDDVEAALVTKFGRSEVTRNDKCLTVKANSYRVETDVVPTWNHRRYRENGTFLLGAKFYSDLRKEIINYPVQHIENGIKKNTDTQRRFKRLVRLHKKLRYKMKEDDNYHISNNISSFLLECLVWNIPDSILNDNDSWQERLKQSIIYIYNHTKDPDLSEKWGEVSEALYLFYNGRKWNPSDVKDYMNNLWNYLEY